MSLSEIFSNRPFVNAVYPAKEAMTKRSKLYLMLAALLIVFAACEYEDEPVTAVQHRASRIEQIAYKRELIYNGSGQLIKVVSESTLPDKEVLSTIHT
jgi:hypothetical protein